MKKITQLFIRACKRSNAEEAVKRIIKRFYFGADTSQKEFYVTASTLLAPIVDKYCPMDLVSVLRLLKEWEHRADSFEGRTFYMLRDRIAHTDAKHFEGLRKPAWLRNKQKRWDNE